MSFATGVFPNIYKLARTCSVFKDGNSSNCTNYRPLSLISTLSKIFRKCMGETLYSYLEKFELLHKYQYGSPHKQSTSHALIWKTTFAIDLLS